MLAFFMKTVTSLFFSLSLLQEGEEVSSNPWRRGKNKEKVGKKRAGKHMQYKKLRGLAEKVQNLNITRIKTKEGPHRRVTRKKVCDGKQRHYRNQHSP